jgi:protein phosphatase methylesterase 1
MPSQVVEGGIDKATGLKKYVWRTDLLKTMPHWSGWFKGLTETFLNVKVKKQLLLAGADRMDTKLT